MPHHAPDRLAKMAADIEHALDNGQTEPLCRILKKRSAALRTLLGGSDDAAMPVELIARLIQENERWIARGTEHTAAIRDELSRLKAQKSATSTLTTAYGRSTAQGRCIERTG